MNKLRLSYSFLNLWRAGRIDDALVTYFHLAKISSQAMEDGNMWDKHVQEAVQRLKTLPQEFGGTKLSEPKTQLRLIVPFNEKVDIIGIPDIYDEPIVYEIKTGSSKTSADYANDFQIPIYFYVLHKSKYPVEKAIILRYNQYIDKLDKTIVYFSQREMERGINFIETLAPEIMDYWNQHSLWDKEKQNT